MGDRRCSWTLGVEAAALWGSFPYHSCWKHMPLFGKCSTSGAVLVLRLFRWARRDFCIFMLLCNEGDKLNDYYSNNRRYIDLTWIVEMYLGPNSSFSPTLICTFSMGQLFPILGWNPGKFSWVLVIIKRSLIVFSQRNSLNYFNS